MNDNCLKIAIDGGAATGKTTVANLVSKKINAKFISSGLLYRYATLIAYKHNLLENEEELLKLLEKSNIHFKGEHLSSIFNYDNNLLVSKEVVSNVSPVAKMSRVRDFVNKKLKQIIDSECSIIVEGRDIGTIVMPNADFKFFMTVSPLEAAKRRFSENELGNLIEKTIKDFIVQEEKEQEDLYSNFSSQIGTYFLDALKEYSKSEVLENIISRNKIDSSREVAPLKKADDAIVISTDNKTIDKVVDEIVGIINGK